MQQIFKISSHSQTGVYDIPRGLESLVTESGESTDMVNVYAREAIAGIMI